MRRLSAIVAAFTLFALVGGNAAAARRSQRLPTNACLTTLLRNLRATYAKFPLKSQETLRRTAIRTYQKEFQNCIKNVQAKLKERGRKVATFDEIFNDYLRRIKIAAITFKTKKLSRQQQMYAKAAQKAADANLKFVKPPQAGTTVQDVMNKFIRRLKKIQFDMRMTPRLGTGAVSFASKMFDLETRLADLGDLNRRRGMWERNAKRARKEFPTSSAALKKRNEKLAKLIESGAKKILDLQEKAVQKAEKER